MFHHIVSIHMMGCVTRICDSWTQLYIDVIDVFADLTTFLTLLQSKWPRKFFSLSSNVFSLYTIFNMTLILLSSWPKDYSVHQPLNDPKHIHITSHDITMKNIRKQNREKNLISFLLMMRFYRCSLFCSISI